MMLHQRQRTALRPAPPLALHLAAIDAPPLLIVGEDDAPPAVHVAAQIVFPKRAGPLRTLIGSAHRHWHASIPSCRNGYAQPVESLGEEFLAYDGECEFNVLDYQTQAFRLIMTVDGERREWICDHLRLLRAGIVEAVEVKINPGQLDARYKRKMLKAGEILGRLGWRVTVRFEDDLRGTRGRQENRESIAGDGDVFVDDAIEAFDRLAVSESTTSFGRLCDELSTSRHPGRAKAHRMIVAGRVGFDMDRILHRSSPVTLHPAPAFINVIRPQA